MNVVYNRLWSTDIKRVSVITPVYNRRLELPRALMSLEQQTCLDIEHIVINDGSIQLIDDIMEDYMDRVNYPVAYIKKDNGGVHTARNAGIKVSRGKYMAFLDSDDEFLPHFIETFLTAWDSIPEEIRGEYRECNAFCVDQYGRRIGEHLPQDINKLPYDRANYIARKGKRGEKVGFYNASLMRDNPWPEPKGVKVVSENILWAQLEYKYKTWFLDNELRVYYTESYDGLTNANSKLKEQTLINALYNSLWFVNNGRRYGLSRRALLFNSIKFMTFKWLLKRLYKYPSYDWAEQGVFLPLDRILHAFLLLPTFFLSLVYQYKYRTRSK